MRTAPTAVLVLASVLALGAGCYRPSAIGYFDETAYYPARGHYRVGFDGPDGSRVLLRGWTLTDFARRDGVPTTAIGNVSSHTQRFNYDPDDTGRSRLVIDETRDLRLAHDDGSRILMWTEPLTRAASTFDLGEMVVALAMASVARSNMTVTIAEHAPVSLDGQPAHQVFFEVVDPTPLATGIRRMPIRNCLVAVRPDRRWIPNGSTEDPSEGMPMVVLMVLSADADRFDARYAEWEALLGRIDFR